MTIEIKKQEEKEVQHFTQENAVSFDREKDRLEYSKNHLENALEELVVFTQFIKFKLIRHNLAIKFTANQPFLEAIIASCKKTAKVLLPLAWEALQMCENSNLPKEKIEEVRKMLVEAESELKKTQKDAELKASSYVPASNEEEKDLGYEFKWKESSPGSGDFNCILRETGNIGHFGQNKQKKCSESSQVDENTQNKPTSPNLLNIKT